MAFDFSLYGTGTPVSGNSLALVLDQINAKGPLTVILNAHQEFTNDDLLLLSCDMTEK